jgi:hypothetical protein
MLRDYSVDAIRRERQAANAQTTRDAMSAASVFERAWSVFKKPTSSRQAGRTETSRIAHHRMAAPSLRQTYRLGVVCHAADSKAVEAELKSMFDEWLDHRLAALRSDQLDVRPSHGFVCRFDR